MFIRNAQEKDSAKIAEIYNGYVANSIATFEEEPVSADEMSLRINKVKDAKLHWLVAEQDNQVLGYAYACPWKPRAAYKHSVEISVYLSPEAEGRGTGTLLYKELIKKLSDSRVNAVMAGIALPNEASIALHEKFGMKKVAHFEAVGFKHSQWIDVAYWQLLLDQ